MLINITRICHSFIGAMITSFVYIVVHTNFDVFHFMDAIKIPVTYGKLSLQLFRDNKRVCLTCNRWRVHFTFVILRINRSMFTWLTRFSHFPNLSINDSLESGGIRFRVICNAIAPFAMIYNAMAQFNNYSRSFPSTFPNLLQFYVISHVNPMGLSHPITQN